MAKDPQANLFEGKNDIQNRNKTLVILSKAKVQEFPKKVKSLKVSNSLLRGRKSFWACLA